MYLNFTVAKGTSVGLVKYNNTAYNLTTGLRKINNQEDRDYLMNLVPKKERKGGSAIGLGLRLATKVRAERCIQMYVLTVAPIFTFFLSSLHPHSPKASTYRNKNRFPST